MQIVTGSIHLFVVRWESVSLGIVMKLVIKTVIGDFRLIQDVHATGIITGVGVLVPLLLLSGHPSVGRYEGIQVDDISVTRLID